MKIIILISTYCCLIMTTHARPYQTVSRPFMPDSHHDFDLELEPAASDVMPMQEFLTDQFDMFVPVDHNEHDGAASMVMQNFEKFTNSEMVSDMEESHFLPEKTVVRGPKALSHKERKARSVIEHADPWEEHQAQRYLQVGDISPLEGAGSNRWELFDYDSYSGHPGEDSRYTRGY